MEYNHLHENTYEALDMLVEEGVLESKSFEGNRWYFQSGYAWSDVESLAVQKRN